GGPYSKATPTSVLWVLLRQLLDWRTAVPMVATFLLAINPRGRSSWIARAWSWAWLGALFYRAIHPVQHDYLAYPVLLVGSITWALPLSYLISIRRIAKPVRIIVVALLAYEIVPAPPWMCDPRESAEALRVLVRGEVPPDGPLGASHAYPGGPRSGRWSRYCA